MSHKTHNLQDNYCNLVSFSSIGRDFVALKSWKQRELEKLET